MSESGDGFARRVEDEEHRAELRVDLADVELVDVDCVDRLARVVLEARRLGCSVVFLRADPDLRALVAFAGLDDVIAFREQVSGDAG